MFKRFRRTVLFLCFWLTLVGLASIGFCQAPAHSTPAPTATTLLTGNLMLDLKVVAIIVGVVGAWWNLRGDLREVRKSVEDHHKDVDKHPGRWSLVELEGQFVTRREHIDYVNIQKEQLDRLISKVDTLLERSSQNVG